MAKPVMGGANIGSLNSLQFASICFNLLQFASICFNFLLKPYNIAFGDQRVLTGNFFSGDFIMDKRQVVIDSENFFVGNRDCKVS